jgi:hypothetical protein
VIHPDMMRAPSCDQDGEVAAGNTSSPLLIT